MIGIQWCLIGGCWCQQRLQVFSPDRRFWPRTFLTQWLLFRVNRTTYSIFGYLRWRVRFGSRVQQSLLRQRSVQQSRRINWHIRWLTIGFLLLGYRFHRSGFYFRGGNQRGFCSHQWACLPRNWVWRSLRLKMSIFLRSLKVPPAKQPTQPTIQSNVNSHLWGFRYSPLGTSFILWSSYSTVGLWVFH